jgi:hypothetical protein
VEGAHELCKTEMNQTEGEGKEQKKAFLNNGHKIYLPVSNLKQGVAYSRSFGLYFPGSTGVDEVCDELKTESGKVETVYDLSGRKVDTLSKGIYIINGKKVLVK